MNTLRILKALCATFVLGVTFTRDMIKFLVATLGFNIKTITYTLQSARVDLSQTALLIKQVFFCKI